MRASKQRRWGWGWLLSLLWSAALGVAIYLCAQRLNDTESPLAPLLPAPPSANWAADFPARIDRITDTLGHLAWPLPTPSEEPEGAGELRWTLRRYALSLPKPDEPGSIERTLEPVRTAARGVSVQVNSDAVGAQVQIGIEGLLTHTLTLHWLGRRPRAAIIIQALGDDLRVARALADLKAPLTFAVMPFHPFSKQVAELAALLQHEVVLDLPMAADDGDDAAGQRILRTDASREEILRDLDESLTEVSQTTGTKGCLGSPFNSDRERRRWVLEHLKAKSLFFVDSRTTSRGAGCDLAADIALACATRDVTLDDIDDEGTIRTQIEALIKLARARGDAIALGHPRPATLAALAAALPQFAAAEVDIVPISAIVADQSLSRR